MLCNRLAGASLFIFLLGYEPWTTLAQGRDPSGVHTSLRDTDPVDLGTVISRGPDSVSVRNELFTRVFRIVAKTQIVRVDSSELQVGDRVAIRCHLDDKGMSIADSIEANVDRWEGVITKVAKDAAWIKFHPPIRGTAKVDFDGNTEFRYCASDDPGHTCTINDLKVGRHLETTGFVLGKGEMRAVRVLSIQKR